MLSVNSVTQMNKTLCIFFGDCPVVQQFWNYVENKFLLKLPHAQTFQLSKRINHFWDKTAYADMVTDKPMDVFILN